MSFLFMPLNPLGIVSVEFDSGIDYPVREELHAVFLADLNNDGLNDTVTANYYGANVSVLINNGNGTFATHVHYYVDENSRSLFLADLDNNLYIDIVTANIGDSDGVSMLYK